MTERIENKRFEKNIKLFRLFAILSFVIAMLNLLLRPELLQGKGSFFDFAITLMPIGFYLQYRKKAKNWGGQFIEWANDKIIYKSREREQYSIKTDDIKDVIVKIDSIIIKTNTSEFKINIEDYKDYNDRVKIKNNFDQIKELIE